MGNGSSSSKTTSSMMMMRSMATVKLILINGELQEFSAPVKVRNLLNISKDSFICNSDEMEFDGIVNPINGDDELQMGQLYFELPWSRLTQPLQPEEMASLAVKANTALQRKFSHSINEIQYSRGCCFGSIYNSKRVDPSGFVFYSSSSTHHEDDNCKVNKTTQYQEKDTLMIVNPKGVMVSVKKKKERMLRNYISGRFRGKLSIISEEDQ